MVGRQLANNDELFDQVAKLRPMETALWIGRGQNRALLGNWAEAAADYGKVIDRRPIADESFEYAGLLLLQGDKQAYQHFCKKLVKLPAESHEPWELYNLARTCALGPTDTVDGSKVVEWAARGVTWSDAPWTLHALGLACFRAGQYDAAVRNIQKSTVRGWNSTQQSPSNCLVLAMVHYRLAHTDQARRFLQQARSLIECCKTASEIEDRIGVPEWIEANVLLREAESLLKSDTLNSKSQTPMPHS